MRRASAPESRPPQRSEPASLFYGKNQKYVLIVGLCLLVLYHFGRPTLERWLGVELPAVIANETVPTAPEKKSSPQPEPRESRPPTRDPESRNPTPETFPLERLNGRDVKTPAGLIYGRGPNGESRLDHVLRHAEDLPQRPVHSVFDGDRDTILRTIDEAYELVRQRSNRVRSRTSDEDASRMEHLVDLQRPIGYRGGQDGKRDGYPKLRKVKLILEDGNRVITAYPN